MGEHIAYQQIAVFPTNVEGRQLLGGFQKENRVVSIAAGEIVNDNKREPCLWVIYVPGLDPYVEASRENDNGNAEGDIKQGVKKKRV